MQPYNTTTDRHQVKIALRQLYDVSPMVNQAATAFLLRAMGTLWCRHNGVFGQRVQAGCQAKMTGQLRFDDMAQLHDLGMAECPGLEHYELQHRQRGVVDNDGTYEDVVQLDGDLWAGHDVGFFPTRPACVRPLSLALQAAAGLAWD